jgi:hypothetical protein
MRAAPASGWSPNSCATRAAQPHLPNVRMTAWTASRIDEGLGSSERCSSDSDAKTASAVIFVWSVLHAMTTVSHRPDVYCLRKQL